MINCPWCGAASKKTENVGLYFECDSVVQPDSVLSREQSDKCKRAVSERENAELQRMIANAKKIGPKSVEAEIAGLTELSMSVYKQEIPWIMRILGCRWVDGPGSYRMKWGELTCRPGWCWALALHLFGDDPHYSFHVQIPFLNVYITLPFLRRWTREPNGLMESWGASYDASVDGLHLRWGRRWKIIRMPWIDWVQVSHDVLRPDKMWVPFVDSWEEGPRRVVNDKGATLGGKEPDGRLIETHPYRYMLKTGEVQERMAECYAERRVRRLRWLRWSSLFQRVTYQINVTFSDEVGERTGSWKGGCIGCGYELRPEETIRECLKRMESERKF